jgi:uncharacterized protein YgiM (DUF1202 family)
MKSKSAITGIALFGGCWLIMVFGGCSGPQVQQADANGPRSPLQRPATIEERQIDPLLAIVSQLRIASKESLDAAMLVGTPDHELAEARQFLMSAEQLLQDGRDAYTARQYEQSWDKVRAADAAFRRAEELAVRAGLGQLERELAADYGRVLNPETRSRSRPSGAVRVSQVSVNLRDGAGTNFRVIGTVHLGDMLNLLTELREWYRVQTADGLIGWVSKASVTRVPNP